MFEEKVLKASLFLDLMFLALSGQSPGSLLCPTGAEDELAVLLGLLRNELRRRFRVLEGCVDGRKADQLRTLHQEHEQDEYYQ